MKLTLELELHDQPNPEHFQNFLGFAHLLDRNAVNALTGQVPKGLPANGLPTDDLPGETTDQVRTTGRGRGRGRGATAEQAAAAVTEQVAAAAVAEEAKIEDAAQQGGNGLPPGVERGAQTVVEQTVSGLPPGVTAPVGGNGAAPPAGFAAPPVPVADAAPQVPAMPSVAAPVAGGGDAITIADVQESYATICRRKDGAKEAFAWLRSVTWSDGSEKPRWLNANQIPPEHFDRVMMELSAL